jgi:hypothetical protein
LRLSPELELKIIKKVLFLYTNATFNLQFFISDFFKKATQRMKTKPISPWVAQRNICPSQHMAPQLPGLGWPEPNPLLRVRK